MPVEITVSVTLTKHDIWQYFLASNKKIHIYLLVLYVIFIASAAYLLYGGSSITTIISILVYQLTILLIAVIFAVLFLLAPFFNYRRLAAECRDSKALERPARYHMSPDGFFTQTEWEQISLKWREIYKVVETRSQMLIYQSVAKVCIIPKRCFSCAGQLQAFIDLAAAGVERKKLKIKRYSFNGFSPEAVAFTPPAPKEEPVRSAVTTDDHPLMSISVTLSKREALNLNMYHYYSQPAGILLTLLGIVLLCLVGCLSATGGGTVFRLSVCGFLGIYLLIGAPILITVQASRLYKSDASIRDAAITYHFYGNRITAETSKGGETRYFGDFQRLKQHKGSYLLYLTKRQVLPDPRKVHPRSGAF